VAFMGARKDAYRVLKMKPLKKKDTALKTKA
jgi:hypothetical protein